MAKQPVNKIVCVVDDEPLVHFVTKKILRDLVPAENVLSFSNGGEILRYLESNLDNDTKLPDLILLDINMPEVSGIEFLNQYVAIKRKLQKQIKIYVISSSMNKEDIYRAKNDPNTMGFISKPISRTTLETILNT